MLVGTGLARRPRPNILLLVSDDQSRCNTDDHGNKENETPHRRTSLGTSRPDTLRRRADLMTKRLGVGTDLYNPHLHSDTLHPDAVAAAEVLQSPGHGPGTFGKCHFGEHLSHVPDRRGFNKAIYIPFGHPGRHCCPQFLLKKRKRTGVRGHTANVLNRSDRCGVGFAPARRDRLCTAHLAVAAALTGAGPGDTLYTSRQWRRRPPLARV